MTFGEKLRSLREQRGWSIEELSQRSRLATSHIQYIERDGRPPAKATIGRLASAFGIDPDDLGPAQSAPRPPL